MAFTFAAYEAETRCSGGARPGAVALAAYLEDRFPWQTSMGIYACRNARGTSSLSEHAGGRAYDAGVPTNAGKPRPEYGDQIVGLLGPHGKRLGVELLIYNRRAWSANSPGGKYYGGVHPHYDHVHIGLNEKAGEILNRTTLIDVLGPAEEQPEVAMFCKKGDNNQAVNALQRGIIHVLGRTTEVLGKPMVVDGGKDGGGYGPQTAAGLAMATGRTGEVDEFGARAYWELHIAIVREHGGGGSSGLSQAEADGRYTRKGAKITVVGKTP